MHSSARNAISRKKFARHENCLQSCEDKEGHMVGQDETRLLRAIWGNITAVHKPPVTASATVGKDRILGLLIRTVALHHAIHLWEEN